VNDQFGLDLKAVRQHRKRFDEAAREHPVAGEDVVESLAEHARQECRQHPVAGAVPAPVGRLPLTDLKPTTMSRCSPKSFSISRGALAAS
jgi:hypothetical protein